MLFDIMIYYYFIIFMYGSCLIYKVKLIFKLKIGKCYFFKKYICVYLIQLQDYFCKKQYNNQLMLYYIVKYWVCNVSLLINKQLYEFILVKYVDFGKIEVYFIKYLLVKNL